MPGNSIRPTPLPIFGLNAVRAAHQRMRAEAQMLIADDISSALDVIAEAATPAGRPLLKLRVSQVLSAQKTCSPSRAGQLAQKLAERAGVPNTPRSEMTLGWLVDNRASGRRILAYLDVVEMNRREPPWSGFPFTPRPTAAATTPGA